KGAMLLGQSRSDSLLQAHPDHFEGGERRRVVSTGPLEHLLAGGPIHQAASHSRPVQQQPGSSALGLSLRKSLAYQAVGRQNRYPSENTGRDQLVYQTESERLGSALALARQNHVQCRPHSDETGQTLATAGARD